jgi:hypothetical protein
MIKRLAYKSDNSDKSEMKARFQVRKTRVRLPVLFAILGAVTVMSLSTRASAAITSPVQCTPTDVAYFNSGTSSYAIFVCGGNNFTAWLTGPAAGCNTSSIDAIKIWQSMSQAALLSGKKLGMAFTTCTNGQFGLIQMDLLQ